MNEAMKHFLSIVVPIYKVKEEHLRKCIDSLLNQTYSDFSIIFIDDGSPDNCGEICDEYMKMDDRISVIHQKNQGVSVARNNGIKMAKTEWIAFVDPDDWIEEDTVQSIWNIVSNNKEEIDIIMFDYVREYPKVRSIEEFCETSGLCNNKQLEECRKAPFYKLIQDNSVNPYSISAVWNKVYRTDFLKSRNIYFLPEARKGQDRLFNTDVFLSANAVYYLHKCLYHYRCHGESVTNKYNKDIVFLTKLEINELQRLIYKHKCDITYNNILRARTCTRIYSCLRLNLFNRGNGIKFSKKKKEVNALIEQEPFRSALNQVELKLLNRKEKIFVLCLKYRLLTICYLLVCLQNYITKNKLIATE